MSYFVVDPKSGQKYGPAELSVLNSWAAQGRIHQDTIIEDTITGSHQRACELYGLNLPPVPPPNPQFSQFREPPSPYPRQSGAPGQSPGQADVTNAWIYFALGFAVCSIIFLPLSIISANKAIAQGNTSANVAKILSIVLLILNLLAVVAFVGFIALAASNP
ncbi:MAG: hypothetical protein IT206_07470 [Fimbriimonadaceae bacterium]|nr:hypothetical protein [Fimbriimonadaceae bacterium]